jgi:hypothetical protein
MAIPESPSLAAALMGWLVRDKRLQIGFEPSHETGMRMKFDFIGRSGSDPRNQLPVCAR